METGKRVLAEGEGEGGGLGVLGGAFNVAWIAEGHFGPLGGMMMLSFFIHNCIQTIAKQSPQRTVKTDVVIA